MVNQWQLICAGSDNPHTVVFHGKKEEGTFIVIIDGEYKELPVVSDKAEFIIDGLSCYVSLLPSSERAEFFVDGNVQPYSEATIVPELTPLDVKPAGKDTYRGKNSKYTSSFLSFVIFNFVNIVLLTIGATIYFPFSSATTSLATAMGKEFLADPEFQVFGIILYAFAILMSGLFLLLYHLSKKHNACVLIALVLVVMDLAVVVFMYYDNIAQGIVDIAFHVWIIVSLFKLYRSNKTIKTNLQ